MLADDARQTCPAGRSGCHRADSSRAMDIRLIVTSGKASKQSMPLALPATIGRSREADLTIGHPMVSRRHCELTEAEGIVRVRDLGSLNGTVVGGERVSDVLLRPDEEFTVGPLTFRVVYSLAGRYPSFADESPTVADPAPSPAQSEAAHPPALDGPGGSDLEETMTAPEEPPPVAEKKPAAEPEAKPPLGSIAPAHDAPSRDDEALRRLLRKLP